MKQKKLSARILSLVLTAAMALTMLPATSIKAEAAEGGATITPRTTPLDLRATSLSYVDTKGITKTANPTTTSIVDTGEGWAWNNTTKTLTLDGVNIDCTENAPKAGVAFGIQLAIDHDIVLAEGSTNTVKAGTSTDTEQYDGSYGVYFSGEEGTDASPSISGKGTLNATGGVSGIESAGILCEAATLKFSEATINASSSSSASTYMGTGISGMINIESGTIKATGTATGDGSSGFGIQTEKMTMSGGNVTATGTATATDTTSTHGYGISGYGSFSMTGGKLSASGATAAIEIYDVHAETSTYTINAEGASVTGESETFVSGTTKTLTQANAATPVVISFAPKVTFDTRNGVDIPDEVISEGGTITMPTNPVWGNYRFDGWYTDLDGADTKFVNSGLTDSITVYAKWIATNRKTVCTAPLDFTVANKDIDRSETEGWKWDNTGKTLTLSGATIDCTGNDAVAGIVCAIQLLTDHDIVLETGSTNIVKAGASTNSISRGIYFEEIEESDTTPSIGGSGTLKVTGGAARGVGSGSFGIVCDVTEKFAFIGNATVIASSSAEAQLGAGIAGLIEIQSGKITANGTGIIHGYGIQSTGMTMIGGNVTATGIATGTATGTETTYSCGISVNGGVGMTGGKLSASGATAAISTEGEGAKITASGATVTVTGENETFTSGTTKTLTQKDDEIPVVISFTPSVTFDARNGVDIPDAVISEGDTITMPANPTWEEGYIFAGWYTDIDGDGVVFKNENLTESDTVYAKWTKGDKTVCTEALDFTTVNKDIGNDSEGWAWDNASKTLTLSGATIDCSGHDAAAGIVYGIRLSNDHDIFLAKNSTNIVKAGDSADSISIGIDYNENAANPLISGEGTLDVTGGAVGNEGFGSFGIVCSETETLTFKDATIVASSSAEAERGGGIAGLIDIQSGKITATGTGTIYGYGIQLTGMTMSGGDVTATGTGTALGCGIAGRGDFDLEGGTLTLSGTTAAMATELGTINANGAEVTGENETFESGTTKTLTQAAQRTPVVISFATKAEYTGENPNAPALISKTHVTVTLNTQTITGETVEYGIKTIFGKIDWQDSPAFTGLTANTEYKFYARVKANANHKAGIKSDATVIKTKTRPVTVSGTVTNSSDAPVSGADVKLTGSNAFHTTTTNASGVYSFKDVDEGVYSLVVTSGTAPVITITETVTVEGTPITNDIKFLEGNKNTVVESTDGTPKVAVEGLNDLLNTTNLGTTLTENEKTAVTDGGSVELKFTANLKMPSEVDADKTAIESVAGEQKIDLLLDLSVKKTVKKNNGKIVTNGTPITTLADIIEVYLSIPPELQGKDGLSLYRMHDGVPEKLQKDTADTAGEYYTIDPSGEYMTLYVKNFSTYALGYNTFIVDIWEGATGASAGGEYSNGETVTINAGTKSGYSFNGWEVIPKTVTLANPSSAKTTFVMPAGDVDVTANWKYIVYSDDESTTVTYVNTMNKPENGTASMSPDWPSKGQVITITTKPNAGYVVDSVIAKDASGKVIAVAEKGENSYTFSQPDSKVAVEVTYKKIGASGAHAFTDVAANDWFYAAVTKATANGWFSGTSDTIFSPLAPTSRGMAATILHRIEGQPKVNGSMFKDVTADAYYANGIAWAAEKSITRGYDNGNYGPNDNITREQLATILYRYAGFKGYDLSKRAALDGFIDGNSVSDYAKEAMSWAVGSGIITGRENNTLAPTQIANRAEVAAILVRFAELFAK